MKFAELLGQYTNEEIVGMLVAEYPEEESSVQGYFDALAEIRTLDAKESDLTIIAYWTVDDFDDTLEYVHVGGEKEDEDIGYAIEFTDWREWLGMEVGAHDKIEDISFLAHCLWEMTFTGYTNKEVLDQFALIMSDAKECEERLEAGEDCLIAFEDLEELGDGEIEDEAA